MPFVSLGMSVVATCADSLLTALVDESEQVRSFLLVQFHSLFTVFQMR